jgi:hypothetical protein
MNWAQITVKKSKVLNISFILILGFYVSGIFWNFLEFSGIFWNFLNFLDFFDFFLTFLIFLDFLIFCYIEPTVYMMLHVVIKVSFGNCSYFDSYKFSELSPIIFSTPSSVL